MPRLIVTDSGATEREVDRLFVVDSGGTTRNIQRLFCIDSGGTARQIFAAFALALNNFSVSAEVTPTAITTITIGTNGQLSTTSNETGTSNSSTDWGRPLTTSIGDEYEVRLTVNSGNNPTSGDSLNTWLALTSQRSWTLTANTALLFNSCTLSIGLIGTSTALVSCTAEMVSNSTGV